MKRTRLLSALLLLSALPAAAGTVSVSLDPKVADGPLDGRLLLLLSTDDASEPRFQLSWNVTRSMQVFGLDVEGWGPDSEPVAFGAEAVGYPVERWGRIEPGDYWVQAVFHRYDTFTRADGHTVKLPASWEAGQQWNREPGNLYSEPVLLSIDPKGGTNYGIPLHRVIEPVEPPEDTRYVRHVKMKSELLSKFWGRDFYLGAHVLVPEGFDEHPEVRYPLMIFHGHYPADFGGFRTEPPDPDLECEYSERFRVECYNRIQQQEAYDFYQRWISPDFPRFLVVEIQHANPYYDDSYAVNSANLGPFGDAITYELVPFLEEKFRGLGEGWSRFLYGGSTGGWEALAAQIFYPEEYNGAFGACPDPIDFRAYMTVNIYEDENAYFARGPFGQVERPGLRDWRGHVSATLRDFNRMERALGSRGRSGQQFDIWEAVYSPVDEDGLPKRLWDKATGEIDPEVAEAWKAYDLGLILRERWEELGPQLEGKLHIYCGDMDNYYLNNAVYLVEEFLESTTDPYYGGEVDYGDRAEHCWNGDHENGNHISRLRYNTFYLPKILARIEASAPPGADLTSWRH
ncbi:MAG: alpha/beta hydrolase-fold protein [Thermoanaerobaculia bacterium]|nr:alpha/beta hydrolase-fold protein [Thermoanaerobaculia bacterium]